MEGKVEDTLTTYGELEGKKGRIGVHVGSVSEISMKNIRLT